MRKIVLERVNFLQDVKVATLNFDSKIGARDGKSFEDVAQIVIFSNSPEQITGLVSGKEDQDLKSHQTLAEIPQVSIKKIEINDKKILIRLESKENVNKGTMAIRLKVKEALTDPTDPHATFSKRLITVPNIMIYTSKAEQVMEASAGAMQSTLAVFSFSAFLVSIPQAFVLMKLFQTVDFYVFIDCIYPSNFSKFIDIISKNVLDLIPNIFEALTDEEGLPVYERFREFGYKIHLFHNLGSMLTFLLIVLTVKFLLFLLAWKFGKKVKFFRTLNSSLGVSFFYGLIESFHLDIVLSIIIHVAQRNEVKHSALSTRFLTIIIMALTCVSLAILYLFMGISVQVVSRRKKRPLELLEGPQEENIHFLLDDKVPDGNLFQRNYNLLMLMRDLYNVGVLYSLYYSPGPLILLLTAYQTLLTAFTLLKPPYKRRLFNISAKCQQIGYLLLNLLFIINIYSPNMPIKSRYLYLGHCLIVVVSFIIGSTIIFNVVIDGIIGVRKWWKERKAEREKKKKVEREKKMREKESEGGEKGDMKEGEDVGSVSGISEQNLSLVSQNNSLGPVSGFNQVGPAQGQGLKVDGEDGISDKGQNRIKKKIKKRINISEKADAKSVLTGYSKEEFGAKAAFGLTPSMTLAPAKKLLKKKLNKKTSGMKNIKNEVQDSQSKSQSLGKSDQPPSINSTSSPQNLLDSSQNLAPNRQISPTQFSETPKVTPAPEASNNPSEKPTSQFKP